MDTHMDLYIEHYNDLHTYINDNICKINYNSELLTEAQLPFHTLVINFFKKSASSHFKDSKIITIQLNNDL